jgi:alpha-1,2-mannosyltransferase
MHTPAPPRGLVVLSAAAGVLLLVAFIRLIAFLQAPDPLAASGWSATPWNDFLTRHACSTAYWQSATTIDSAPNVYHPSTYATGRFDPVTQRPIPRFIGPFSIDPYEYPPTFLIVPRALARLTHDYPTFRRVWISLCLAVALAALVVVARRVDVATGGHARWLAPLVLLPPGILATVQAGNVQLAIFGLAMLAMLAFERRQPAAGGLLLGFTVVAKMFPAMLVLYLAVRRDWRAVAWTAVWCVALVLLSLADIGWAPFDHFREHLPKLLSGEAFPMLRIRGAPDVSLSAPGVILKLTTLGGPAVPLDALRVAGWVYTALILVATVLLALRPLPERLAPLAWLIVLGLASLRSPFLPFYGAFAAFWIATLLLGTFWHVARIRWVAVGAWTLLLPVWAGPPGTPPALIAAVTTLQIAVILGLFVFAVRVAGNARARPAHSAEAIA